MFSVCFFMLFEVQLDAMFQEQMTWVDFQAQLENPHLQQLFHALDVDESGLPGEGPRQHFRIVFFG